MMSKSRGLEFHPSCQCALGLSIEEKDLLVCTGIGRWPLPLPSYLCNPANALGLSIEEKDLLFCTGIGRWPLPLPSYLCNAIGLSMEENDLLQMAH